MGKLAVTHPEISTPDRPRVEHASSPGTEMEISPLGGPENKKL